MLKFHVERRARLIKMKLKYISGFILICFCLLFSYKIFSVSKKISFDYHFSLLAESFLRGRLDIKPNSPHFPPGDIAFFNNKYFVYFGPLPSVLLVPLVALFGSSFPQNSLTLLTSILSFWFIIKISQRFKFRLSDSLWLSSFYIFGTIYSFLVLVNISAFQVQALGNFFMLLSLYEFFHKRRYLLIGFYLSLAIATRVNLIVALLFFILAICQEKISLREKTNYFINLLFPIVLTVYFLLLYNFARFHNIFETGYRYNITFPYSANFAAAKKFGIFSLYHIPINIYYFLFKGPELVKDSNGFPIFPFLKANEWGLSIIFTSPLLVFPFFFLDFKKNLKELLTIIFISLSIFTYYGVGFSQFGYRYALDFYPFLFLILLNSLEGKLLTIHKILIVYSILFNFLFMLSGWGRYPLLGIIGI